MDFHNLNFVDYLVICIALLSTLFGFIRGFVGSFLSFTGWAASIYLSYLLFPEIKDLVSGKLKNPIIAMVVGHTALLLGFLIIFGIFNLLASNAVKSMTKGIIDRSLGAAFGLIRGGIIVSFIFFIMVTSISTFNGSRNLSKTEDLLPKWITKAQSYSLLNSGQDMITEFIPDNFYKGIQEAYEQVSSKPVDERFLENISNRLRESLDKEQLEEIDQAAKEASADLSDEQLQSKIANDLLNAFKRKRGTGDFDLDSSVSEEDISRLESLLKKSKSHINTKPAQVELLDEDGL